jgi:hypothetical protein
VGVRLRVTRTVTPEECPWLDETYWPGEILEEFTGATYGCVQATGVACSRDGRNPFFELPADALEVYRV